MIVQSARAMVSADSEGHENDEHVLHASDPDKGLAKLSYVPVCV